jgi:3-hydroxyisobutyrate dehydrogenase-like beta-hydroxyacid dehydrogenase
VRAPEDPRPTVGLIGLGNMGTAFAERLLAAGYHLVVSNRSPEKLEAVVALGAERAATPEDLAQRVDVVLTSLANDEAFEAVVGRVLATSHPGLFLADLSTVSPAASTRAAALADAASVQYVRAPVSGNPTVVRAGNLSFIVSGSDDAIDAVEPVLLAIGPTVLRVGDEEQARVVKLAINVMIAVLVQAMSEAVVLGEASGVSRGAILEVMRRSAVGAPLVNYKSEPLLNDDYSATFTTSLMEKDIDLALDAAEKAGVELPLAEEMKAHLRATIEDGYGEADFLALFQHLRRTCGMDTADDRARWADAHSHKEAVR